MRERFEPKRNGETQVGEEGEILRTKNADTDRASAE
jgi:hypothetical protein